jgi:pimeloyl-ACP methyl ester carboxylesterase
MATFVIVHGAWSGGWYFQDTARIMRREGHDVYTPTLTGIGKRVHLGHPDVDLSTHILDIVNVFKYEDLHDVTLVGYSYGGMVVTGVAEQIPERIKQLVYLDAIVPTDGQSAADLLPEMTAALAEVAQEVGDGWQIPHNPPHPQKTPHPLKTLTEPIEVKNLVATQLPRTYVLFTENTFDFAPHMAKIGTRIQSEGGAYRELAVDHVAPETHPETIAELLLEFA